MNAEITELAQLAATTFAALGLLLTAWEISRSVKERRIERVDRVRQEVFGNTDAREIYYLLEYSDFKYTDDFHESVQEKQLDMLLCLFDTLAKQVDMGLLKLVDLDLVAYEYMVIYQDDNVQAYLAYLDSWFDTRGFKRQQYEAFREVGAKLEKRI